MFEILDGYSVTKTRELTGEDEKKALDEKLEIAKSLLDVLDVETISKKFKIKVNEVEKLKNRD